MNTKRILLLGGIAAVLVVFGLVGILPNPLTLNTPQEPAVSITGYASTTLGFVFGYPENYELREFPLVNGDEKWTAITLVDKDILKSAQENGASEGPPMIAIQIFNNPKKLSAKDWLTSSQFSNFSFSNGSLSTTTVAGEEAWGYIYSGLFTTDVVVTTHNDKIYMFLVDWITEEDINRRIFDEIISSVIFNI